MQAYLLIPGKGRDFTQDELLEIKKFLIDSSVVGTHMEEVRGIESVTMKLIVEAAEIKRDGMNSAFQA